jgi:tRNA-specific 2-thiouridylase
VVVGEENELQTRDVAIGGLNWLDTEPHVGEELLVQVRHRARAVRGEVVAVGDVIELKLHEPQRAVTPGQSGVLYRGDVLVGGGRLRAWEPG